MAQRWSPALQEAWPDGFCWRECAEGRSSHSYRRVDLCVTRVSWPAAILNARFKVLRCRIQADIHVKPPMLPAKRRRTITSMFGVSEQSVHEDQLCPLFCKICVPFLKWIMWMCRFGHRIFDAKAATETVTGFWKMCERLPLVAWCHCSCSQYPRLRRAVSSDCDWRKPHHSGVWVQWHPTPQLGLEEGWWACGSPNRVKFKI